MDVELSHGGHISEAWEIAQSWVSVPLERGDMLVFGSHLAHRSARNLASAKRASLYATYHMRADGEDLRAKYYAHRRANFPPDHGKSSSTLQIFLLFLSECCMLIYFVTKRARTR